MRGLWQRVRSWWARSDERGSAVVGFALVAPLLVALALAVIQVALTMHVRTTITSAATEGARAAATAGSTAVIGEERTRMLLERTLAGGLVQSIDVRAEVHHGARLVAVEVEANLPLLGLLGPASMTVVGHALQEGT